MGTETIRTCDVYGRRKDVRMVRIRIEVALCADPRPDDWKNDHIQVGDLSPKALERAKRLIDKAVSSPKRKAKAAS